MLYTGILAKLIYALASAEARAKSAEARATSAEKILEDTCLNIDMMLAIRKNFIETIKKINSEFLEYNKKLQDAHSEIAELNKALAYVEAYAKANTNTM
jgi:uncharacterized protein involved in exopolysaccharide biosynthesis